MFEEASYYSAEHLHLGLIIHSQRLRTPLSEAMFNLRPTPFS